MSDIVERLSYDAPANGDKDRFEAAREITRLRAELAMALDAAAKGDNARFTAAGMEMEIFDLRAKIERLEARLAEAVRLLRRAMNESARVHPDFMQEILDFLHPIDSAEVPPSPPLFPVRQVPGRRRKIEQNGNDVVAGLIEQHADPDDDCFRADHGRP